jgi:LmbE family N-acetylglucosaminyl deacetylase
MKKYLLLFVLHFINSLHVFSQISSQQSAGELIQAIKKLNVVSSVLYIAAHPDDENTRLLAYLANEKKVRTAYLSLTRGDGGQNLIGKEQGEALGLIRTQELLAARRTDGAEQFFTRANDFGYSKNPEETFSIWKKEMILADVVLTIRKFKPDVIICRFPTTGEGGHGHHTASAILALEAFDAAADSSKFPEQLKHTHVWQAKRIFWNTFNFGTTNTTAPNQLKIDVGVFNPLLGKSYGEIASESRSMHKSQGFGSARQRGSNLEYFKLLKGDSVKTDLLEGINTTWSRFKSTVAIQKLIDRCIKEMDAQSPEKLIPNLVALYKELQKLQENDVLINYWKQQKIKEVEQLIISCSGLWLEASVADYMATPNQDIAITAQVIDRNKYDVKLNSISFLQQTDTVTNLTLKQNELYTFKHKEKLATTTAFSNPYWLNGFHEIGFYSVTNTDLIGKPENDPAAKVIFNILVNDLNLKIERALVSKYTDPVKGEVYRPLEILPPATINLPEKAFVFTDKTPKIIQLTVKANTNNVNGKIALASLNQNISVKLKAQELKLKNKGDEAVIEATLTPTGTDKELFENDATKGRILQAYLFIDDKPYSKSIKRIEYDHIPYQFILSDAEAGLVNVEVKKTGLNIAYIPGAGDDVPACLRQMGYNVTLLNDELLASDDLTKYNAIVTGVRAYNTNERLQLYYTKLMDYVKAGGNLIVQYNTNNRIGPLQAKIGPYPFTISRDRVTNENATAQFTNEKHPVLNFPNQITAKDFEGWVQERGIYFAADIGTSYETVLSMNDPEEKPTNGSLIIAKYGKGNFVYTGLSFFRQLPAGVSGAYRLFANLLSLPQNK